MLLERRLQQLGLSLDERIDMREYPEIYESNTENYLMKCICCKHTMSISPRGKGHAWCEDLIIYYKWLCGCNHAVNQTSLI